MDMNDIQKILSDKKVTEMISKMSSGEIQSLLKEKGINITEADVKKVIEAISSQKGGLDLNSIANMAGGLFGKKSND